MYSLTKKLHDINLMIENVKFKLKHNDDFFNSASINLLQILIEKISTDVLLLLNTFKNYQKFSQNFIYKKKVI